MIQYGRHPGESQRDAMLRKSADYDAAFAASMARMAAFIGPRERVRPDIALGVGTYDANGTGKGAGW